MEGRLRHRRKDESLTADITLSPWWSRYRIKRMSREVDTQMTHTAKIPITVLLQMSDILICVTRFFASSCILSLAMATPHCHVYRIIKFVTHLFIHHHEAGPILRGAGCICPKSACKNSLRKFCIYPGPFWMKSQSMLACSKCAADSTDAGSCQEMICCSCNSWCTDLVLSSVRLDTHLVNYMIAKIGPFLL